jgi:ribosomal protein S18
MDRLYKLKDDILSCVENQVKSNLRDVDTKELGEAVDIIKDLSEAIYYCTITDAMHSSDDYEKKPYRRDMSKVEHYGPEDMSSVMHYSGSGMGRDRGDSPSYYPNAWEVYPIESGWKTTNESESAKHRRYYMEGKVAHHDKSKQMHELESYITELGKDLTEMIEDASAEEKQMLQQKIQMLATKIK